MEGRANAKSTDEKETLVLDQFKTRIRQVGWSNISLNLISRIVYNFVCFIKNSFP